MRFAEVSGARRRAASVAAVGAVVSLLVALGTALQPATALDPVTTPTTPTPTAPTDAPTSTVPTSTVPTSTVPTPTVPTATATPEPTAEPTAEPTGGPTTGPTSSASPEPEEDGKVELDDAVLTWSMSQQTNALSHNPGAINFLSAGVADPGRGGATLRERDWRATAGNVTVEKQRANGSWARATWAGLGTDAAGEPIGVYGPFSGHRIRATGGTGVVDPVADDADLRWSGTWTVVYYGGNTVFTLTDPRVRVRGGRGTLTALAGGWGSDRNDPSAWDPVPSRRVAVVSLSGVDVQADGLVVTPDYAEVKVEGTVPQRRTGEGWGSFHPELVGFLAPMGTDQFWYSTGLQSDWTKVPAPLALSWGGAAPEAPRDPSPTPSVRPRPTNEVVTRPSTSASPTGAPRTPTSPVAPAPPLVTVPVPSDAPLAVSPPTARQRGGTLGAPVQVTAASHASGVAGASARPVAPWAAAGLLLLGAALLLVLPVGRRSPS